MSNSQKSNQEITNSTQFWDKGRLFIQLTKGQDKELAQHYLHHFQSVNFPLWISIIEEARENEIRLRARNNEDYEPETYLEYDPLLNFLKDQQEEFEIYKNKVLSC